MNPETLVAATGCAACGAVSVEKIAAGADEAFRQWLREGRHADMEWLGSHADLRLHPRSILPEAKTVICFAFRFPKPEKASLTVAAYALGRDYHKAIKSRLKPFCEALRGMYGGATRICVDSAPLAERYWALKAGIASRGLNGMALVKGCGPYAFLAEVLTDAEIQFPATHFAVDGKVEPAGRPPVCLGCGECISACPTGALGTDGTIDCRRCLSYLTIEHRGDFDPKTGEMISRLRSPFPLLGCDRCLSACPLGADSGAPVIADLMPRPELESLTGEKLLSLSDAELDTLTAGTSLRRPGPAALRRNASLSLDTDPKSVSE